MINIVTLCGSTRHKDLYVHWNKQLTIAGYAVFSCGFFGHTEPKPLSAKRKALLDRIHLRKIDLSDAVFVIDPTNKHGSSTTAEIRYARAHNVPVLFAHSELTTDILQDLHDAIPRRYVGST